MPIAAMLSMPPSKCAATCKAGALSMRAGALRLACTAPASGTLLGLRNLQALHDDGILGAAQILYLESNQRKPTLSSRLDSSPKNTISIAEQKN